MRPLRGSGNVRRGVASSGERSKACAGGTAQEDRASRRFLLSQPFRAGLTSGAPTALWVETVYRMANERWPREFSGVRELAPAFSATAETLAASKMRLEESL